MEGYRLLPIMFSREEIISFITAEKLIQSFIGSGIDKHFKSVFGKIQSVIEYSERESISILDKQILISSLSRCSANSNQLLKDSWVLIFESIVEKK